MSTLCLEDTKKHFSPKMLPFPLKEARALMSALSRADYKYYIFAHSDNSPSPPVHTLLDLYTASLLSDYIGKVARGGHAEDVDFSVLEVEDEEVEEDEIFR